MTKFASRALLLLTICFAVIPSSANAFDIPVLTWEKGRVQEVILGDASTSTDWKLELVGKDTEPVLFTASRQNEAGYYVYSATIPSNLPDGAYSLESSGGGIPRTIVAGVNLIAAEVYDIRSKSVDLTLVVGLFTFITVTLSSLRSKKYSTLTAAKSDLENQPLQESFMGRLTSKVVHIRRELTQGVSPSLFRYLLGQESQFLLKLSKPSYYLLPALGVAFGFFAAINAQANGGLEKSNLLYFFILTAIGLIDSFSGIFALFTFWAVQFFYGDVANVNQILIVVAAAIAWIGPSLAARIYQDAIKKDFNQAQAASLIGLVASAVGSAVAATALFFGGYKLLISLLGEVSAGWQMKPGYLACIFVIAIAKAFIREKFASQSITDTGEGFEIVRVVSPQVAFAAFLITYGFGYIWTASALKALLAAALFAAPYFLLFIRFETIGTAMFARIKRSILLESAVAVAASYLIYVQVQRLPQLSDQRAEIYLIAAAIPGLIHGIYSSICDSAQREERITP